MAPSPPDGPDLRRAEIDITQAHMSRAYDWLLGGNTNFEADRIAVQQAAEVYEGGLDRIRIDARANRAFLGRVTHWLATEAGIRQFLDLGTGIPSDDNVHAVLEAVTPDTVTVYVDHDSVVLAHAHKLVGDLENVDYIDADIRDIDTILTRAARTIDFDQPVALCCFGILHVLTDDEAPRVVDALLDAACPGSYLAISQMASDVDPSATEFIERMNDTSVETYRLRSRDEVARFFERTELVDPPGLVRADQWHGTSDPDAWPIIVWGGVGRLP